MVKRKNKLNQVESQQHKVDKLKKIKFSILKKKLFGRLKSHSVIITSSKFL